MIYIKNIRDIQEIFIPRTELDSETYIVTNKTYENGFIDGKSAGIELQKSKLTNLVVSDNGLYERENGWNRVEVNVPDIPSKTQEKTLYVTKDTDVVLPDEGYDGLSQVNINATQYGQDKRNEGYTDGFNSGKVEGTEEGYQNGYADGKTEGITIQKSKLTNLSVTANGTYERTDGWNEINVNVPSQTYNLQQKNITLTNDIEEVFPDEGYDALSKVDIDATEFGNKKFSDGHFQGKTEGYEGGKADGIEEGYNDGYTDGKTDGIEEGYNQGYADGKSESGSCNLIPLFDTPNWEGNNLLNYYPYEYNADGFSSLSIQIGSIYNEAYNQGRTEGYTEGYQNGKSDVELIEITDAPKMSDVNLRNELVYTPSRYSADGFSKVTINVTNIYDEGYAEGQKSGAGIINVGEVGIKFGYSTFTELPPYYDFKDVENMDRMFYECQYLRTIPELNTSNITSMQYTFELCRNLTTIPMLDTSNVTDMRGTFSDCEKLTTIPELNTSSVWSMYSLFQSCASLTSIPYLDTSEVVDMQDMFAGCKNLTSIPNLITDNVEYMSSMFSSCQSLTTIPELNTSNVIWMDYFISRCINLVSVPPLNAGKVTKIDSFFGGLELTKLTDFGGLIGLKISMTDNYGFVKTPNLSYQSCINILNGLYDFVGNGKTPSSLQGKLKVHQNFLNLVGDQISIATNKGWTITA